MISIIIPVFNREKELINLLEDIYSQEINEEFEVIIVDDNSNCDFSKLKQSFEGVKILKNDRRRGPAFCRNFGAQCAKGDIFWFLDSDVRIENRYIMETLIDKLKDQKIGCTGGEYTYSNGRKVYLIKKILLNGDTLTLWKKRLIEETIVDYIATSNLMVRKEVFEKVRGFFDRYSFYGEDKMFGQSVRSCGYLNMFVKRGSVFHTFSPENRIRDFYLKNLTRLVFLKKFYPWRLNIIWALDIITYIVHFRGLFRNLEQKLVAGSKTKNTILYIKNLARAYCDFFIERNI